MPRDAAHINAYELVLSGADSALSTGARTVAVASQEGDQGQFNHPVNRTCDRGAHPYFHLPAAAVDEAVRTARSLVGLDGSSDDARVVKFSPRYKLVISLLNQNSPAGEAVLKWNIDTLLERECVQASNDGSNRC